MFELPEYSTEMQMMRDGGDFFTGLLNTVSYIVMFAIDFVFCTVDYIVDREANNIAHCMNDVRNDYAC